MPDPRRPKADPLNVRIGETYEDRRARLELEGAFVVRQWNAAIARMPDAARRFLELAWSPTGFRMRRRRGRVLARVFGGTLALVARVRANLEALDELRELEAKIARAEVVRPRPRAGLVCRVIGHRWIAPPPPDPGERFPIWRPSRCARCRAEACIAAHAPVVVRTVERP